MSDWNVTTNCPPGRPATSGAPWFPCVSTLTRVSPVVATPSASKRRDTTASPLKSLPAPVPLEKVLEVKVTTKPPSSVAATRGSNWLKLVVRLTWNCAPTGVPSPSNTRANTPAPEPSRLLLSSKTTT